MLFVSIDFLFHYDSTICLVLISLRVDSFLQNGAITCFLWSVYASISSAIPSTSSFPSFQKEARHGTILQHIGNILQAPDNGFYGTISFHHRPILSKQQGSFLPINGPYNMFNHLSFGSAKIRSASGGSSKP